LGKNLFLELFNHGGILLHKDKGDTFQLSEFRIAIETFECKLFHWDDAVFEDKSQMKEGGKVRQENYQVFIKT